MVSQLLILTISVVLWCIPETIAAQMPSGSLPGVENNVGSESPECSQHVAFVGGHNLVQQRSEEQVALHSSHIHVAVPGSIGVVVFNSGSTPSSIRFCKLASGETETSDHQMLESEHLVVQGGEVSISPRPDPHARFAGALLLSVSADSELTIDTQNGGISLLHTSASIHAHSVNGGITVKDGSGDVVVDSLNGGLNLVMPAEWKGKGLGAHTTNGGVTVSVPEGYATPSNIKLTSNWSSACSAEACHSSNVAISDQEIRIGHGQTKVDISSDHGSVRVRDRRPQA